MLFFFFFNDTATTEIYTLSLHDALPICRGERHVRARARQRADPRSGRRPRQLHPRRREPGRARPRGRRHREQPPHPDRKSTRLNSSHLVISYAVFCLKKKNNNTRCTNRSTVKTNNRHCLSISPCTIISQAQRELVIMSSPFRASRSVPVRLNISVPHA